MKKALALVLLASLLVSPVWAVTAEELVRHFEQSQKWVSSAMISFSLQKRASDARIADMYEFVADKSYEFQGMIINGEMFQGGKAGALEPLAKIIGNGVIGVLHKLTTDDHKTLFKPTWIGYHTPGDKRVSNWFCLILGDHTKTYLTRVDQRSKLDEIGTDPLQLNVLDKNLFNYEVIKEGADSAVLKVTPKDRANTNMDEAIIELGKLQIGTSETWYAKKIQVKQSTGATGMTEYGKFRVAAAPAGAPIVYSSDPNERGAAQIVGLENASSLQVKEGDKLYVFATQIQNTNYQKPAKGDTGEYSIDLLLTVKRLFINPAPETMLSKIEQARFNTIVKIAKKVVAGH